jgi:hypothetical protein
LYRFLYYPFDFAAAGFVVARDSTASRFAAMRLWLYRSSMARLMWPISASMVLSGTPASAIFVAAVCRRSCRRHKTPESFRTLSQAGFSVVVGRVGSLATDPNGEQVIFGARLAKLLREPGRMSGEQHEEVIVHRDHTPGTG